MQQELTNIQTDQYGIFCLVLTILSEGVSAACPLRP